MRNRCNIFYRSNTQACLLHRCDSGFPTRAGAFNLNLDFSDSMTDSCTGTLLRGTLSGKRGAFPRPFETYCAGRVVANRISVHICNRYQGVIKRRLDMGGSFGNIPSDSSFCRFCHIAFSSVCLSGAKCLSL
jgi:hypothetical protein